MTRLVINDTIELAIANFNQNLSKDNQNVNMSLNAQLILTPGNTDLTSQLKDCIGDNTVDVIKILDEDDHVLYYTEVYTDVNNVSFGADFNSGNSDTTIGGYINFNASENVSVGGSQV